MSRNLGQSNCHFCYGEVKVVEEARPVTEKDTFSTYFTDYRGLIVAWAECVDCEAKYLAWLDDTHMAGSWNTRTPETDEDGKLRPRDLSFRSSFNDEPGPADMPTYAITRPPVRAPWYTCAKCGGPRSSAAGDCKVDYKHTREKEGVEDEAVP